MSRLKTVGSLCLVALVVLSGCAAFESGDSGTPAATSDTDAPATGQSDEQTATQTQTPEPTPESIDHPTGWNESGIADGLEAYHAHYEALYTYNSFTRIERSPYLEPHQTLSSIGRYDQDAKLLDIAYNVTENGSTIMEQGEYQSEKQYYFMNGTDSRNYEHAERYSYDSYMKHRTNRPYARSGPVYYAVSDVYYDGAERIVRDGETMFEYQSNELQPNGTLSFVPPVLGETTAEEFSMTTIVDGDGMIRQIEYEITYTIAGRGTFTRTGSLEFTKLDDTTVNEPDWLDEAKAAS